MKHSILSVLVLFVLAINMQAQKQLCKDGHVWFYGSTPLENVEAHSKTAAGIIDQSNGSVVVNALLKSFEFEKALMEEHFNENYVESDKFPKAVFKGSIVNLADIQFAKDGVYKATVKGDLNLHGVSKAVETVVTFTVKSGNLHVEGKFIVTPQDFNIAIPSLVQDKIAKNIEIHIDMNFKVM